MHCIVMYIFRLKAPLPEYSLKLQTFWTSIKYLIPYLPTFSFRQLSGPHTKFSNRQLVFPLIFEMKCANLATQTFKVTAFKATASRIHQTLQKSFENDLRQPWLLTGVFLSRLQILMVLVNTHLVFTKWEVQPRLTQLVAQYDIYWHDWKKS